MNFYKVFNSATDDRPHYDTTMEEAKATVQSYVPDHRPLVRVELTDISITKEAICSYLNCSDANLGISTVLRTWYGTTRGGLKEIVNGE